MRHFFRSRTTVSDYKTIEGAIIRLTHRTSYADISGHAGNDQVLDPFDAQKQLEVCMSESSTPRLVNDRLIGQGIKLMDCIVAGLAADQQTTERAFIANTYTSRIVAGAEGFPRGER